MDKSTEIIFPDGRKSTLKKEADKLGILLASMNHRVRKWGLNDPRTFASREEVRRGLRKSQHDGKIYKCPFYKLEGAVGECAKALGVTEINFKVRIRDYGKDAPNTWFTKYQAETYRKMRLLKNKGCDDSRYREKLVKTMEKWDGKFNFDERGVIHRV